jgi:hypothetical protein
MNRPRVLGRIRQACEERLPAPAREAAARARSAKDRLLERVVNAFFPTNSSGNNASRG